MAGQRRGNRLLILLLGAIALLSISIGSLPFVEAESEAIEEDADETETSQEEEEEEVCIWDEDEGREKCGEETTEYTEDNDYDGYYSVPNEDEEWDLWEHGTKMDLYTALDCPDYDYSNDEMFKDTSFENIHTVETWQTFNRIYNEVIAATQGDKELQQDSTIPDKFDKNGFQFPIEIKFDPVKGRGVYAKSDIPKGSLLYLSTNNGAFFHGKNYRNFLKALPSKLACDVQIWAFVRWVSLETEFNDKHMACVDLDEGSFVNTAEDMETYNMALGNDEGVMYGEGTEEEEEELWYGCKMKFYAYRDIKAGGEILASYGDFAEADGWRYLGL